MNPEEIQTDKPDNAINSGSNPEKTEIHSEFASGEMSGHEESLISEELTEIKKTGSSDVEEFTGKSETVRSDDEEFTGVVEDMGTLGESGLKKTSGHPEMNDNSEESEMSYSVGAVDIPEQEEIADDIHIMEKSQFADNREESGTAGDGIDQTDAADRLTPEEKERINKYKKFKKVDGSTYRRVNQFLRKHTYITAREWAIARLCADFSTRGGAEMTFIGENLPELIPFMTDTYSPQAVNQARSSFKKKVKKSGATFFYGALCGFFTADELDDILFESSEVARFLLEIEGTSVDIDDEIDIEDKITDVMRSVAEASSMIRAPKTVSDEPEDNFEYEDIPEENIPEECYSDLEGLTEDLDIKDE